MVLLKIKLISQKQKMHFVQKNYPFFCGKKCILFDTTKFHTISYNSYNFIQFATEIYSEFNHILDYTVLILMTILLSSCALFS